jgi:hypothetical protein
MIPSSGRKTNSPMLVIIRSNMRFVVGIPGCIFTFYLKVVVYFRQRGDYE